jgi:hypothetical protein
MRTAWLCPFLNNLAAMAVMAIPSCLENLELVYALYMQGFKRKPKESDSIDFLFLGAYGGCLPAIQSTRRIFTKPLRLSFNAATVVRPMAVKPII